jgi:hypothetical protein
MYYVIKKQHNKPGSTFIGFAVPKYIASKKSENVIFLFQKNGKVIRKWIKLKDIILLTGDEAYYEKVMKQFREAERQQQELVDEAHAQLEQSMTNFVDTMNAEIHDYEEIRNSKDVPCILKAL